MHKLIYKIVQGILKLQVFIHHKRLKHLHKKITKNSKNTILPENVELTLNIETENKKAQITKEIKEILKNNKNNPEKLLDFIKNEGTDIFRINNANKFLKLIGEDEGFIPPLYGINALFLNLFINLFAYKKIVLSLKSNEMFILRPLAIDVYSMIHQFYLWYSFKYEHPNYTLKNRKKFKKILESMNDEEISKLSLDDILEMKEAIAMDVDAIDFVVNLANESETSTKLLNKIKDGQSIKL